MRDPRTAQEWQDAVDGASFLLHVADGVKYGLLTWSGPDIDEARCRDLVERGRAIGFEPCPVEEYVEREFGRVGS